MDYGEDFYIFMSSPPPGRENFVIGTGTVDKVIKLYGKFMTSLQYFVGKAKMYAGNHRVCSTFYFE